MIVIGTITYSVEPEFQQANTLQTCHPALLTLTGSLGELLLHNSLTLQLESVRQVQDPGDRGGAHVYLTGVGVCDGLGVVTFRVQRELLLQVDEVICVLGREGGIIGTGRCRLRRVLGCILILSSCIWHDCILKMKYELMKLCFVPTSNPPLYVHTILLIVNQL